MKQRVIALLYHDVISGNDPDVSGFSGINPAEYKISVQEFDEQLRSIKNALKGPVVDAYELDGSNSPTPPVLLTFDDGGMSAYEHIAPMLESYGWRGCFFITTDCVDSPSFVRRDQIKDLRRRGHVIGSHSCSHPRKISDCSRKQLLDEWGKSISILSDIIGEPVTVASIPGGFYSRKIAEAAAECGIQKLFTSEPVQKIKWMGDCAVVGRFSIKRGSGPNVPADFVSGNLMRRFRQYTYWNTKKIAKIMAGPLYARLRTFVLARRKF